MRNYANERSMQKAGGYSFIASHFTVVDDCPLRFCYDIRLKFILDSTANCGFLFAGTAPVIPVDAT